jgi:dephospho-CoA kinase
LTRARPWPPSRTSPPPSPRRLPRSPLRSKTPASRRPPPHLTSSSSPRRPVSVAITGGIGTGKSTALKLFSRHGAATVSSDDIVHNLLATDEEVRRELLGKLGEGILDDDGTIDRRKVGRIVFQDRDLLLWLEQLLHPRVAREYLTWREQLAHLPIPPRVCVTEVPLLYETGGDARFDVVVALTASPRIRERRGRPVPEDRARRQLPDDEKLSRAHYSYVNNGSIEDLDAFVASVMSDLEHRDANVT